MPTPSNSGMPNRFLITWGLGAFAFLVALLVLPDSLRTALLALAIIALFAAGILVAERRRSGAPTSNRTTEGENLGFLQQLIDSIPDPSFIKDETHRWLAVNQQASDLFGLDREKVVGLTDSELFPPTLSRLFMDSDDQAIGQSTVVRTRWRLNRRDLRGESNALTDEILEGCTHKKRLLARDGRRLVIGIVRDVSEVVASEDELRRQRDLAQRKATSSAEFLSTLGHEIRNPLQAMLGATEMLRSERLEGSAAETARILHRAGENLLALVNDILELSRLESGATVVREDPLDMSSLVSETVDLFSPLVASRGGSLACSLPASPVLAIGDEIRIRQILSNLANNAVRYAGHTSIRIELETEHPGEDGKGVVRVSVTDKGPGFEPEEGPDLFLKWHRAAGNRRGSGLGLAIVHESVQLLGGTVRAEGRVGLGARFVVELPMRLREDAPRAMESADDTRAFAVRTPEALPVGPSPAGDLEGLRVLVAEDNRTNQMVLCRQLDRLNCRTTLAQDGQQALDLLRRDRYDVVLMDCQMPVTDGFEATRIWRTEESERLLARTPILAVTALTLNAEREECLDAGMDEVLTKPLRQADLESALSRWAPRRAGA